MNSEIKITLHFCGDFLLWKIILFSQSKRSKNIQKSIQYIIDFFSFFKIHELSKNSNYLKDCRSSDTKVTTDRKVIAKFEIKSFSKFFVQIGHTSNDSNQNTTKFKNT